MENHVLLFDLAQIAALLVILTLLVKPLGSYMARVYQGERTWLSPALAPLENLLYKVAAIDRDQEMDWKQYAVAMLIFNGLGVLVVFAVLLLQGWLPLNPEKFPGFSWDLGLNTAVSFVTNTNWQSYSGEAAASYFSQVLALMVQQFLSAASGMAILMALIRGFARHTAETLGNFWVDLTRGTLYILLPLSLIAAIFLVSQGVIQNFSPYVKTTLIQSVQDAKGNAVTEQTLPMGPVAAQEAIKEVGTNGGGFFNANSAHPFENPTPLSNFVEILLILLIPAGLTYTFGRLVGSSRQGWAIYVAMLFLFIGALATLYLAESHGNPLVQKLGVPGISMEGKEVRFGLGGSVLFSSATTGTSCGAVNNMHDSLTPIGGLVPLMLILLGEIVFGGVGSGLYTMLAFVVIAVFVAGLMIGRTPEYLGKKLEVMEMWMSVVIVLSAGIVVLVFVSVALLVPEAVKAMANPGAHGLSEVLYAFASTANNNGSAFAGLNANTGFYNLMCAAAMVLGRFAPKVAVLAMAGSLVRKKYVPPSLGTLPTDQAPFIIWLVIVIVIVGALTFFPVLAMGPIVEHLIMRGGL
ncbi:MAG: potassium-transporting ATPase subunit KdpA [Deltaproteobacteria bacterium]|nr:potassium-transporting ATPase subunit KdpA [Deltaproteobacteria bacterium]